MTLGELIRNYMNEHDMSFRDFAKACGITAGYVSMLIKNVNPKTGLPPTPGIKVYNGIARAMGISIDELFRMIDDSPVAAEDDEAVWASREDLRRNPDRRALMKLATRASDADVRQVAALVDALRATNPDFYDGDDPA